MENEVNEVVEVANDTTIDYKAKFEAAETEANRLNTIIQKHKKTPKESSSVESPMGEAELNEAMDKRDAVNAFYSSNPDLSEHKEAMNTYTSKGYSLEHAKLAVLNDDSTIQNRAIAQQSNFTAGVPDYQTSSYTKDQLGDMSQSDYNKAMDLIEQGKATIK